MLPSGSSRADCAFCSALWGCSVPASEAFGWGPLLPAARQFEAVALLPLVVEGIGRGEDVFTDRTRSDNIEGIGFLAGADVLLVDRLS